MATPNISIDYTNRTREVIAAEAKSLIPHFLPEWTDHADNDAGIAIIEAMSVMADNLHFYVDQISKEAFLSTAVHRRSVGNILELIDYSMQSASPSSGEITITLSTAAAADVTVPVGTKVSTSTSPPIVFETQTEITISAGNLSVTGITVKQGLTVVESLTASDGMANQERALANNSIIDGSLQIFVNEGILIEWTVTDTLENSAANDTVVEYEKDAYGNYVLYFGDNANGHIPTNGAALVAQYRIGGGTSTNVAAGSVNTLVSTLIDDLGNPVIPIVANPIPMTGGANRQVINDAKRLGPRTLRALYRGVSGPDIETLANNIAGVEKVKAVNTGYNIIDIYVAPSGGGVASATLLAEVASHFNVTAGVMCFTHRAYTAEYVSIEITATVYVLSAYRQNYVQLDVRSALNTYFSLANLDFGVDVRLSDVFALIEEIDGVEYVEISRLTLTPEAEYATWSGDSTIDSITITSAAVAETWTIYFTSPTHFTVTGSVSGYQGEEDVGVAFTSNDNKISFIITAGVTPNTLADNATIRVSSVRDTVAVLDDEIPTEQTGDFVLTYEGGIE